MQMPTRNPSTALKSLFATVIAAAFGRTTERNKKLSDITDGTDVPANKRVKNVMGYTAARAFLDRIRVENNLNVRIAQARAIGAGDINVILKTPSNKDWRNAFIGYVDDVINTDAVLQQIEGKPVSLELHSFRQQVQFYAEEHGMQFYDVKLSDVNPQLISRCAELLRETMAKYATSLEQLGNELNSMPRA